MQLSLYNSPLVLSGANPTLSVHPDTVVKVYNGANGQSPIAEIIDQIARAPFGEMLTDKEESVTEVAKRFFQVFDKVSDYIKGWTNQTDWDGTVNLGVYRNIKFLGEGDFVNNKLPMNIQENDTGTLKECMNLFYFFSNDAYNGSFRIRLSLNGSCDIFKPQHECMRYLYPIFNTERFVVLNPYIALDLRGNGVVDNFKNFTLSLPSKIINASWILQAEAHGRYFEDTFPGYVLEKFNRFSQCEQKSIDQQNYNYKVITGLGFTGIILVFLTTIGIGYRNMVLLREEDRLNEENTVMACPPV